MDAVVNGVILVTCAIVTTAILTKTLYPSGKAPELKPFKVGEAADTLPDVRYGDVGVSLIVYLRSTCPYCTNSMPFYRRLSDELARRRDGRLVVVSSEPLEVVDAYLRQHALRVDRVAKSPSRLVPTPTLLAVDRAGIVRGAWSGQADEDVQREILGTIAGPSTAD